MIHRFWTGPPRAGRDYAQALRDVNDDELTDWTPETLPDDLQPLCSVIDDPRRTSNLVRFALLSRFGGLWVDCDIEPRQAMNTRSEPWTAAMYGRREACVMWFPEPGHPMMAEALTAAQEAPDTLATQILTEVGAEHPEVALEPRVLPYDALGRLTNVSDPLAIHLWDTSGRMEGRRALA